MVDESGVAPVEIFVATAEIISLVSSASNTPFPWNGITYATIQNGDVHKYARGTRIFYKDFYDCWRGAKMKKEKLEAKANDYVATTNRALVELLVSRKAKDRQIILDEVIE